MKLYTLYIGHNNSTLKRFKEAKINKIISKYFIGYTIQKVTGYYEGIKEESFKVEIITNNDQKVDNLKSFLVLDLLASNLLN